MKLFINEKEVEFELTGEKNIKDLLDSLKDYAKSQKSIVSSLTIDGEDQTSFLTSQANENPSAKYLSPLEQVNEVWLELTPPIHYTVDVLKQIPQYLEGYRHPIDLKGVESVFLDMQKRLQWLNEMIGSAGKLMNTEHDLVPIQQRLKELGVLLFISRKEKKDWDNKHANKIIDSLLEDLDCIRLKLTVEQTKEVFLRITDLEKKELQQQEREEKIISIFATNNLKWLLIEVKSACELASKLFHVGKHLLGLAITINISDALELFQRGRHYIIEQEISNVDIEKINIEKLQVILESIQAAIENKDFVELADILEYELKEQISELDIQDSKIEKLASPPATQPTDTLNKVLKDKP